MPYTVSTPVFEGPFDLLLHLISSDKVELWEVSLADIVDGYVATIAELGDGLDLETATEFLLIAAVLLELKTRRLLPGRENVEAEEEFALWEERDLLVARLLECKTFKDASRELERRIDEASRSWPRRVGPGELYQSARPDVMAGVTPERLRDVMQRVLEPKPVAKVELTHVAPVRVSVAEAVAGLVVALPERQRVCFTDLVVGLRERLEVIVCFLALLELYKQGCVDLEQATTFGTLQVIWLGENTTDVAGDLVVVEDYEG
ncbi:MAG: segregation and condensation protein A [Acidimicrobiales bacterium]